MIIEFCGLPRTGKTTTINRIMEDNPQIVHWAEAFEEVPVQGAFKEELWYNQLCVDRVSNATPGMYLSDRGLFDRLVMSHTLFQAGLIEERQQKFLEENIIPRINYTNLIVYFDCSVEDSLSRITVEKPCFSQDRGFLELWRNNYHSLSERMNNVVRITKDDVYRL